MRYVVIDQSELSSLLLKEVNYDIKDRIKYFYPQYIDSHTHFMAIDESDKVTAILAIAPDMSGREKCYHIEYVSVDPGFKNQGISKKLISLLVTFCSKNDYSLKYGQVSEDGSKYFLDNLESTCNQFGVVLF